ncbi:MAG: hypothetical protein LC721_05275, partial [Actinobacteria bacterium]|nr:hypothetical protein [Actinomycetota bacterium]
MTDGSVATGSAKGTAQFGVGVQPPATVVAAAVLRRVCAALAAFDGAHILRRAAEGDIAAHVALATPAEVMAVAPTFGDGPAAASVDGAVARRGIRFHLAVPEQLAVVPVAVLPGIREIPAPGHGTGRPGSLYELGTVGSARPLPGRVVLAAQSARDDDALTAFRRTRHTTTSAVIVLTGSDSLEAGPSHHVDEGVHAVVA